jgi:endonuclease/exonuclease/phosphatase family metal-dependent hydrolase
MTAPDPGHEAEPLYAAILPELLPQLECLAACRSVEELLAHPVYRALAPSIERVQNTPDIRDFRTAPAPPRSRYRIVAWNIERGTQLDGQLEMLRCHPYLKESDALLLTEADAGMARSGNRIVCQEIARCLGMAYIFAPCYLALGKGSGMERQASGANTLGLHGNAILSRYPLRDIRLIPLENGVDKIAHREQRIGCQQAVAARVEFPNLSLMAASIHLDAQSTQRHRREQMQVVIDALPPSGPVILGGDWNTSTYDSSHAFWAILGFWLRVLMGVDHVIQNHYLHPDRRFERGLFRLLEERGFDYHGANQPGERTVSYDILDPRANGSLAEWVPEWCFPFIRWSLRRHGGRCPFKLDWFAARGVRVENPTVVHEVRESRAVPLSDHDAIGLDVLV